MTAVFMERMVGIRGKWMGIEKECIYQKFRYEYLGIGIIKMDFGVYR